VPVGLGRELRQKQKGTKDGGGVESALTPQLGEGARGGKLGSSHEKKGGGGGEKLIQKEKRGGCVEGSWGGGGGDPGLGKQIIGETVQNNRRKRWIVAEETAPRQKTRVARQVFGVNDHARLVRLISGKGAIGHQKKKRKGAGALRGEPLKGGKRGNRHGQWKRDKGGLPRKAVQCGKPRQKTVGGEVCTGNMVKGQANRPIQTAAGCWKKGEEFSLG